MSWILKIIGETVVKGIAIKVFQLGKKKLFSFIPFLQAKENNEQLILHIALPSDPTRPARGDAILQGAGFLAAKNQFENQLNIKFHDHKNSNTEIQRIIKEEVIGNAKKDMPICAIFTMSSVSCDVRNEVERLADNDSSIKERISIIFTVSSAPETYSDRTNYFQHFIAGKSEAKEIIKHCRTVKSENRLSSPIVYLLRMNSPYSIQTIKYLNTELAYHQFDCVQIELDENGSISNKDIKRIERKPNENTFCIVIAYDRYLLGALESLSEIEYEGHVLSSATLSVSDWQEYLRKDIKFHNNYLNLKFVDIENFMKPPKGGYERFCKDLKPWTFENVIAERKLYPEDPATTRAYFSKLEQSVYKTILPNYISAFCYDSVRLFSLMAQFNKKSLKQIYDEKHKHVISESSPFADKIDITNQGRVNIDLFVENFSFKDIDKDVLIVVNMQKDFFHKKEFKIPDIESLLPSLTDTIEKAIERGMMIIFKQDWHPEDHYSFTENGGQWKTHCVEKTAGAEFHSTLLPMLPNALIVRAGCKKNEAGYSPYESRKMDVFIDRCKGRIFVTGVALEYGIKETCLESIKKGKTVVVIKPLVRSMGEDENTIKNTWDLLEKSKVGIQDTVLGFTA